MITTAFNFADMLKRIDWVRTSSLSSPDKLAILTEMEAALPPDQFCGSSQQSLRIVKQELANGSAKEAPKAGSKRRAKVPKEVHTEEEPLLLKPDENARGPRTKKAVVN